MVRCKRCIWYDARQNAIARRNTPAASERKVYRFGRAGVFVLAPVSVSSEFFGCARYPLPSTYRCMHCRQTGRACLLATFASLLALLSLSPCRDAQAAQAPCPNSFAALDILEPIPEDVCYYYGDAAVGMYAFSNMAWQTFKYLMWPAKLRDPHDPDADPQTNTVRGNPDPTADLTNIISPRVFETYKADWEVFRPGATAPADWSSYPSIPEPCKDQPIEPGDLVIGSTNEFGNIIEPEGLPSSAVSAQVQQLMHVLVAQNGSLVYYLAAFNKSEFKLIKSNLLYDRRNIPHPSDAGATGVPDKVKAPDGSKGIEGAITIKSAWIEMTRDTLGPDRFYKRRAWVQGPWRMDKMGNPTRTCRYVEIGLVGLHIVHKTKSSPQWIWASFEHVDNAPLHGEPPRRTTFNDGNANHPMLDHPPPWLAAPLPQKPWQPGFTPPPANVERRVAIAPELDDVNRIWQKTLGDVRSVWANYKLVVVQWPWRENSPTLIGLEAFPTPPCRIDGYKNLANSVMETFIQPQGRMCTDPPNQRDQHTCVGCHGNTRSTDFVWALTLNNNSRTGPLNVLSANRSRALEILQQITGNTR
jgi:hypothetical protein